MPLKLVDSPGAGILFKAESIAHPFREEIVQSLKKCAKPPCLVGILSTSLTPSKLYAEFTQKTCAELGVDFILKKIGGASDGGGEEGDGVEEAIIECNQDPNVDGIMVKSSLLN